MVARPGPRSSDAHRGQRPPVELRSRLPVVAPVLLAVAVRMPATAGDARAHQLGPVGARRIEPLLGARVVAEFPDVIRRVRVAAAGGAHACVEARRDVAREHVHDAAQRRRPVQRGPRALHDLDALHVLERHQVPVDPAAVALVRRDAVHEHQHPASQALYVARRPPDVDLPVQELHARRFVHGFVHRVHRSAGELGVAHDGDARDGLVEELGALGSGDDHGPEHDEWKAIGHGRAEYEACLHRVACRDADCVEGRDVADEPRPDDDDARRDPRQTILAAPVRQGAEVWPDDDNFRGAEWSDGLAVHGAVYDRVLRAQDLAPEAERSCREG